MKEKFQAIINNLSKETNSTTNSSTISSTIGVLQERSLHKVLKHYISDDINQQEVKIASFIADVVIEDHIYEIQTGNFNKLRTKLDYYLTQYKTTIVYPIIHEKDLLWEDPVSGEISNKRRSPKRGSFNDFYKEAYKLKNYLGNDNLSFKLLLINALEIRYLNGWSKDKKRGSTRAKLIPLELISEYNIKAKIDYFNLLPNDFKIKGVEFTVKDFAQKTKLIPRRSQEAISVLRSLDILSKTGMQGRAYLYTVNNSYFD